MSVKAAALCCGMRAWGRCARVARQKLLKCHVWVTAASDCGAHARALQYFEAHVRARYGGTLNPVALRNASYGDDDVSFLQAGLQGVWPSGYLAELPSRALCRP